MNDPIAGCDTDSLVKKDGKWQFRDDGRTEAKNEIGPTEEDWDEVMALRNWEDEYLQFCYGYEPATKGF